MQIPPLDIVFLAVIVLAAIRCTFRGFIREFMTMAAVLLGLILALLFAGILAVFLEQYIGNSMLNHVIAFLIIFIVVYLLLKIFETALRNLFDRLNLENLDKSLGFFLGIVEGLVIVTVMVYLMEVQQFFDFRTILDQSIIAAGVRAILPYTLETIQNGWSSMNNV